MADDDFDVSGLAAYLHMMPDRIAKLADRGKIPGRRVGGEWRFSRPEILHWLEDRIGLSEDDEELAKMESQLERTDVTGGGDVLVAELTPLEAIAVPLPARTQTSAIAAMCELAAATGMLWDAEKMKEAVAAREAMASTALDNGAALLHPRRPQSSIMGQAIVSLGVCGTGIPFGNPQGVMTDVFFLICATSDHEYLRILARLSRMINDHQWLASLRESTDAQEARQLLLQRDEELE